MSMKIIEVIDLIGGADLNSKHYEYIPVFLRKGRYKINEPEEGYS